MTTSIDGRPLRRLLVVSPLVALGLAGCGWGSDIGEGSRTDETDEIDETDQSTPVAPDVSGSDVATPDGRRVTVDRVGDGDSIDVVVDGEEIELRLEGYNAPELFAADPDGGPDVRTCNGLSARDAAERILRDAGPVELVITGEDRFGRTLGDLLIDGDPLVDRLISDGHGLATGDDPTRRRAMIEAAGAGRGVWGDGCGKPLVDGLAIGQIQVDAPGDDRDNLTEEYVEIVNLGAAAVDLEGWVLRDDTTSHRFALEGRLDAGERLTVITGGPQGESAAVAGTYHLDEPFPVWSNSWETVILLDPDGVFTDWRFVEDGRILLQ